MATKSKPDTSALKALKAALKAKEPARLYVFHGEETYLRDYYLGRLQALLLPPGAEAFNLKNLDGKTCSALDIIQAADCLPMMAERTMVIVTDYDLFRASEGDREALAAYFADLPEYCVLVFVYDIIPYRVSPAKDDKGKKESAPAQDKALRAALTKYGQVVEFPRQDQGDLTDWVIRRVKATGHDIDTRTAQYLIFLCGDLMTTLAAEIGKVGAYAKGQRVTRQDIDAVATPQLDAVVFGLTDALSARDYDKALEVLGQLLHMQQPTTLLLSTVAKHLRQLYTARLALESHRTENDLITLWSLHPYPAGKLMAAARKIDMKWCRMALEKAAQADVDMKNSYGEEQAILTRLVLELAHG